MMQKILVALLLVPAAVAFSNFQGPTPQPSHMVATSRTTLFANNNNNDQAPGEEKKGGLFSGVSKMFAELDAFMDDASARRLGAGASFYGKRKSSFYGENDKMKKTSEGYDPTEDYRVTAGGNYKWIEDEDGILRPVTRLKNKIMERN